jgi:hypothetical protein
MLKLSEMMIKRAKGLQRRRDILALFDQQPSPSENRILIRADWQEVGQIKTPRLHYLTEPHWTTKKPKWESRRAMLNDKLEEVRRRHERRCNPRRSGRFRWVELDDIYCLIDREHQSNRAYVVARAAECFQTTASDIEKKLKRASAV